MIINKIKISFLVILIAYLSELSDATAQSINHFALNNRNTEFEENIIKEKQKVNSGEFKTDTILLKKLKEKEIKSENFYDSIRTIASQNLITRKAIELILTKNPSNGINMLPELNNSEEYFSKYKGKTIRNIEITKLNVFSPDFKEPLYSGTSWIQDAGNLVHIKTRDNLLKNYLLFAEGDTIDPLELTDNERLLREIEFIKTAYIQVMEVEGSNDLVDILIITRDLWSLGFSANLYNTSSGAIEVFENNLYGLGQKVEGSLFINSDYLPATGYEFAYKFDNISNSYIKSRIKYYNAFDTEKYGIEIWRKFYSYNTKYAGSINISQTSTLKDIKKPDTTLYNTRLNYSTQDIWLGRSFILKNLNPGFYKRSRIVLGARFINTNFYKGPEVSERYNYLYHDNQIFLGSIAFAQQKHIKSNLIYGFGKIEDIPLGNLIQVNFGYEKDEFYKRPYLGLNHSGGMSINKLGYLNYQLEFGGFLYEKRLEQGVISFNTQLISNIHYINRLKFREFLRINYTRGINRFSDENIYLDSRKDIWGLESNYLFGTQKIGAHAETVAYSDMFLYNFRFVFFGFGDIGFIGPENKSLFSNSLYSGIGLGFRVRNENLVFKTFQVRFAYYPLVPEDSNHFYMLISGETYTTPINFEPSAPNTIDYK